MAEIKLTPPAPEGGISIATQGRILKDDEVIRSRVQKADFALGEDSPGQEAIAADFWLGMEQRVREQAALSESVHRRREWMQASSDIIREAATQGRPLTNLEMSYVLDKPTDEVTSDRTALEERYARKSVEDVTEKDVADPKVTESARSVLTKQQIAQRVFEDMQQRYNDTSWASWGYDLAKSFIPFYDWATMKDRIKDVGATSFLPGTNIAEQIRGLYFLPADEFEAKLREAVEGIYNGTSLVEGSVINAMQFAQAAVAYSTNDEFLNDAFSALDVGELGAGVKVAGKLRGLLKETANPKMTNIDRKVIKGAFDEASVDGVRDKVADAGVLKSDAADAKVSDVPTADPSKSAFGLADPENYLRRSGSLTEERQRRLLEQLEQNKEILKSTATDVTHIVRTDEAAFQKGVAEAEKEFLRVNYRLEDAIVETKPVRAQLDEFGQVDRVEFTIGTKDASAFESEGQAAFTAERMYKLPKGSYNIEQVGGSYFIKMEKTVREDSLDVLDARLTTNNQAPVDWKNIWIKWLANPDNVRAPEASAAAKQATYGGNAVMSKMAEVAKQIGALGKNETERLSTILDEARFKTRQVLDPTGQKVTVSGVFYHDVADLEQAYMKRGYSLPSDKEINAYFAFRQLMDYDHAVRNVSVWRDKARLGINQKSIGWIHVDETGKKVYKQSDFFEGRVIDQLPSRSGSPYTLAWYNGDTGKVNFLTSDSIGSYGKWKEIDDLIAKDYKIIQVADPKDAALRDIIKTKGEPIQYILVRDIKEKPLSRMQVPYNEGGHWIYPQMGSYLKQAQTHKTGFGRRIYDGDVTAHYFFSTKEGSTFRDAYETARQMLKANDPNLDAYVTANLPYSPEKFRKLFRTAENTDAPFDLDTPFVLTESGQRTADVQKLEDIFREPIVDAASSEHSLLGKINGQYAQERGERLTSIKNAGTEANPIYKLTGAPLMDSLSALKRSASQLAKSRFFDDYKHRVVENFATQFADVMDVPAQAFAADPMRYLRDPEWRKGADKAKLAAAKQNRRAILYLLGEDTNDIGAIKWMRQKIVDNVLGTKAGPIVDAWKWNKTSDPSVIGRSAVFHMKLGLLNVVQFPLQAQAVLHAAAIDGNLIRAAQANFLYWSMRMRGLAEGNAKAQSMFGKAMSKALGVDQRTVDEMYEAFKKSGMDRLEGEYARLDDYLNPSQLFGKSGVHKGLDAAAVFFKEGNRMHRGVSFATSFLRWRAENPLMKLDAEQMRRIVDRADTYYINMSRASNNDILASSAASVPTQFVTFQKNVMEQLLGKQLTAAEKARVILMYSTVYGLPIGVGLPLAPIWPAAESIRQYTLEQGVDTDANLVTKFLMDGAGSVAIEALTGEKYNFGERYGPGGMTWLRDLLDGELFEVVAGASGSSIANTMAKLDPFARRLVSTFTPGSPEYPITKEDWFDLAREVSSINNIARAYLAVNAGAYMTKGERTVMKMDADITDGIAMAMGLSPQDVTDTYLKIRSMKQEDEAKAVLSKEVLLQFGRALKASSDGDDKSAEEFYKKAHYLIIGANLTPQERGELWQRAVRQFRPLMDQIDRQFMMRDPDKRMQQYLDKEVVE